MATREEAIQKAIDTLVDCCDPTEGGEYDVDHGRRQAAENILSHYRETDLLDGMKEISVTLNVNGAIPVRPMTKAEVQR